MATEQERFDAGERLGDVAPDVAALMKELAADDFSFEVHVIRLEIAHMGRTIASARSLLTHIKEHRRWPSCDF